MNRILHLLTLLVGVGVLAGTAAAFDPPRRIVVLHGAAPDSQEFGNQYCCVGDQNGDGYDDLLVTHDPFQGHIEGQSHPNAVKLYFGGPQMDTVPALVFRQQTVECFGAGIGFLGHFIGNSDHWMVIASTINQDHIEGLEHLYFYRGGPTLDTVPDYTLTQSIDSSYDIGSAINKRPADFNGDGYNDLLVGLAGRNIDDFGGKLMIFFGGEEFDTIPQWSVPMSISKRWQVGGSGYITGGDVNGDGFDDFLVTYFDTSYTKWVDLYLGGSPMDTVPAFHVSLQSFSPKHLVNFAMLGDVNGDGYDDWGCYWYSLGPDTDGFYIFYGSAHPDMMPDREKEGSIQVWDVGYGEIAGGNINGDHFSDVITTIPGAFHHEGQLEIFFGSRDFTARAAIARDISQTYNVYFAHNLGAMGDYNGDGNLDFVSAWYPEYGAPTFGRLSILAGSADWRTSVRKQTEPPTPQLSFYLAPNPFNSTLSIHIQTDLPGSFKLAVLDVRGREVWAASRVIDKGGEINLSFAAENLAAGVYIVRCERTEHSGPPSVLTAKAVLLK